MPTGAVFANEQLKLILNSVAISNIADNAASAPLTNLYISLHTADPSAGNQTTSEAAYTGYTRMSIDRTGAGWTVTGRVASPNSAITFPEGTSGGETCTYAAIGTASSGAGKVLYSGTLSVSIPTGTGVIPQIKTTSTITFN